MKNTVILVKNQVINLLNIGNGEKNKKETLIYTSLSLFSVFMLVCLYNFFSIKSIIEIGLYKYAVSYGVSISFFFVVLATIFRSNSIFFYNKDFEMLSSFPVKKSEIIASKFFLLYLIDLIICESVLLPDVILLLLKQYISIELFLIFLVASIIIPIIPMCVASGLAILIEMLGSLCKRKNIVNITLSFLLFMGYFIVILINREAKYSALEKIIENKLIKIFPFAKLFYIGESLQIRLVIFLFISVAIFSLYFTFSMKNYDKIHLFLNRSFQGKRDANLTIKIKTPFRALFEKELRRYLGSSSYVINTSLGIMILCFVSCGCIIFGISNIENLLGISSLEPILTQYGSLFIASFLIMSCTTSSSISLEGNNLWILQSSPVSTRKIINSKIAVNVLIHFVGYVLAVMMILLKTKLNLLQMSFVLIVPICYSLFISVVGLYLNMRYMKLKWNDEISVVKHSTAAILTNFIAILMIATPVTMMIFLELSYQTIMFILCSLMLIICWKLYRDSLSVKFCN
ncbi:membrane protein [Peptoniphilus lacrimalis DNF00528]|nr:membrane protein [Peptoniphilus lacrimalis DNF00528]